MKYIKCSSSIKVLPLVALLVATAGVAHAATMLTGPCWIRLNVNQLGNAGFETAPVAPWNENGSFYYTSEGDTVTEGFGDYTTASHSGKYGWDMNVGEGEYEGFFNSVLGQTLPSPVLGSTINTASVYAVAEDQELEVTIFYSDGTSHTTDYYANASQAPQGSDGWQLLNFLPAINPGKYVTGIQFTSFSGSGSDIIIDDVSLDVETWIEIP